jgi:hypothetical protein
MTPVVSSAVIGPGPLVTAAGTAESECGQYRRGAMSDLAQEVLRLAPAGHCAIGSGSCEASIFRAS